MTRPEAFSVGKTCVRRHANTGRASVVVRYAPIAWQGHVGIPLAQKNSPKAVEIRPTLKRAEDVHRRSFGSAPLGALGVKIVRRTGPCLPSTCDVETSASTSPTANHGRNAFSGEWVIWPKAMGSMA